MFPNGDDPRKQREGVGKGVKPTVGTLMSTLLPWATGAQSTIHRVYRTHFSMIPPRDGEAGKGKHQLPFFTIPGY